MLKRLSNLKAGNNNQKFMADSLQLKNHFNRLYKTGISNLLNILNFMNSSPPVNQGTKTLLPYECNENYKDRKELQILIPRNNSRSLPNRTA